MATTADPVATRSMLGRALLLLAMLAALLAVTASPATAHEEHKKKKPVAAQVVQPGAQPGGPAAVQNGVMGDHEMMEGMDMEMDRSNMPMFERIYSWFGRLHPMIVHFPIAFFPAAWFTAIVGRRRPAFAAPVQFLVVAGGILAPIAAVAGWLGAMDADPDPVLTYHRWLGVAIGLTGAGLGYWAWRRPWEDRGAGMIVALSLMTVAIAVQGFLGAGVTHGMEHLMF
jgi:uncharacterized membrane protein